MAVTEYYNIIEHLQGSSMHVDIHVLIKNLLHLVFNNVVPTLTTQGATEKGQD